MKTEVRINSDTSLWNALLSDSEFGPELQNLLEIGELIWQRGWAEANAGNVSIRLPQKMVEKIKPLSVIISNRNSSYEMSDKLSDYAFYLVSATGSRYREYKKLGFKNFVIAAVMNAKSKNKHSKQHIIYPVNRKPTSEWQTHLSVQECLRQNRPLEKVVLHAHPTDWIILSNRPEYKNHKKQLAEKISKVLPEVDIYFPDGFVLLPFAAPGSSALAYKTKAALPKSNIIVWEKHGILITAERVNTAFDYMEIMSKAAKVYLAGL